jgi:Helix-turn-helix domain of resolvase
VKFTPLVTVNAGLKLPENQRFEIVGFLALSGRILWFDPRREYSSIPTANSRSRRAQGLSRLAASSRPAEFETNLRRERQLEGIAKAKAAGVYKGRPVSIDTTKVREMKAQGMGASEIAKALRIGRASVYRALSLRNLRANPPRRFDRLPKERTAADIPARDCPPAASLERPEPLPLHLVEVPTGLGFGLFGLQFAGFMDHLERPMRGG